MRIETLGILIVAVGLTCGVTTAAAHEFWVAPQSYSVQPGDRIVTSLRVGKMMRGTDLQLADDGNAVWASYWASITFGSPKSA